MESKTLQKNTADAFRSAKKFTPPSKGNWREELGKVKFCEQRQDDLDKQLKDLVLIANRFGFYDAADFLQNQSK